MNRDAIKSRIERNLAERGEREARIHVQRNPYGGWNVAVVADCFAGLDAGRRREIAFDGLENLQLEWVELVTPGEVEWVGALPGDVELDELPLWPESLGRPELDGAAIHRFLSDLDEDIEPPVVATFYSLRGGVGRSTALAHTARLLAARRRKVVCVDMDLEAPALPVLFGCEGDVADDRGVVDLLVALDQGEAVDLASHLLPVPDTDDVFVLPAGRVSANYARKLALVDPSAWYREDRNPLQELLRGLREGLPFRPDAILLDARTGISDLSGPLLFDLADLAIVVFFPHPQARLGTGLLTRGLLHTRSRRPVPGPERVAPELRFLVSPLPASRSSEVIQRYERRPLEWIESWLDELNAERERRGLMPVEAREITHFVRYREDIATSDVVGGEPEVLSIYRPVADWIEGFLPTVAEQATFGSVTGLKTRVLEALSFSAGTAEHQRDLLETFVQTDNVREAASLDFPLVLGRKGTGKTALFRYLAEGGSDSRAVVVHAPRPLAGGREWLLSPDGFAQVDRILERTGLAWRHFWMLYVAAALELADGAARPGGVPRPAGLDAVTFTSEPGVVEAMEAVAAAGGLFLRDWVRRLDEALSGPTLLLFDGLDTGFGSTPEERRRRTRSISGLFDAWMDVGQDLERLRFKIFLRDDIWRRLDFENRSHLYGRMVRLRWSDQSAFLKVAIKQAMRCEPFTGHPDLRPLAHREVDHWSDDDLRRAWNALVGERMKGGQTAFTRNWVWNRLADGNGDHSPRHLLQLLHEAVPWERRERQRAPYHRSFIRPRALIACLPRVSEEALGALREEFHELGPLLTRLSGIRRTPVPAGELDDLDEQVALALEVGLLSVYEGSADDVRRYKVPDLYRYGLGMTRKGQA